MISSLTIDPTIKVRDPAALLTMPRVIRVTDFTEDAAKSFAKEMSLAHQTGQPIIPIVIDSFGGDPYSLWAMVETVKSSDIPIATIVEGKAMSCGSVFFTCGAAGYRYIGPRSSIMIHDVSVEDFSGNAEDMKVDAAETDRLNKQMYAFMESNIGKPRNYLWRLMQKRGRTDWYITPKEAVKYGLADKVAIPNFRTTVSVSMTLG